MGEQIYSSNDYGAGDCGSIGISQPPYQFTPVAFQLENHIDFIEIYEDGVTLLGSSNINGKVWNGSVWCFKNPESALDKSKSFAGFGLEYCVTCGKFASSPDKVLVGDEAGGLTLLETKQAGSTEMLVHNTTSFAHDRLISAIAPSPDGMKVATSSHDFSMVVWDGSTMEAVQHYRPAHGREVTCVQCAPQDIIFATSSLDGEALLWDCRLSSPATGICKEKFGLTSCEWLRGSSTDQNIVIGDCEGYLTVYDIRQPESAIAHEKILDGAVRSLTSKHGLIASCGDCPSVAVVNSQLVSIYSQKAHPTFANYVAWDPSQLGRLFSCGPNLSLESHSVPVS